jgi:hypothetical protein
MDMRENEIIDYARRLLDAHGDKAEAEAAQKVREFEQQKNTDQQETWQKIRAAITELRASQIG